MRLVSGTTDFLRKLVSGKRMRIVGIVIAGVR